MKIEHVEFYHVAIPLDESFMPAWVPGCPRNENQFLLVRITTDDGIVGESAGLSLGESYASYGPTISSFLVGRDPFNMESFLKLLEIEAISGIRLAWLEPALWDIVGKACGQPVYRLLGGGDAKIRAYCSTGELREPGRRADDLIKFREKGFKAVKLRFHDPDWWAESLPQKNRSACRGSRVEFRSPYVGQRNHPVDKHACYGIDAAL